ncbi:branched-chain amino acid ABC transporter permease [Amycolatopsis sp. CA-161197]|uniref:branched-chain amino acid ABC transporter permease n=1 Tax=unclassified Amycolatopsis TaxID=2618356 RepID=UPI001C69D69A|nr:branched-chain amino acid ABC transporter permease [Amycolatopsis sp. DSM 110486]QYN22025.1 branched-chain amino acid ABC transporter permease [Amycolatopsis sp. DSM 110486]
MSGLIQVIVGGLADGGVYALIALGVSLVYSISRIINLAQGGFVVLAALLAVSIQQWLGVPPLVTVVIVVPLFALLMAVVERLVMAPAAARATPDRMLLVTVGLLQAIGGLLLLVWGNLPYTMQPFSGDTAITIGGVRIVSQYLWIIGALVVTVAALWFLVQRTSLGLTMRATASNPEAAALQGINVGRIRLIAFSLAGAMAALAGTTVIPATFLQFSTVTPYAVAGFIAAVAGGLGSTAGAVVGGLVLGLLQGLFSRYTSGDLAQVIAMAVLIVLLLVRPTGLLGKTSEVRR